MSLWYKYQTQKINTNVCIKNSDMSLLHDYQTQSYKSRRIEAYTKSPIKISTMNIAIIRLEEKYPNIGYHTCYRAATEREAFSNFKLRFCCHIY